METHHAGGRWDWRTGGAWLIVDHLNGDRNGLYGWVECRNSEGRLLAYGTKNLMGANTVRDLLRVIPDTARRQAPWEELLTDSLYRVVRDYLEGEEPTVLADVPAGSFKWALKPLVGATGVTSLIGWGGSTKSIVALAAAVSIAAGDPQPLGLPPNIEGPVLYLDWEADAGTHRDRLAAICRPYRITPPRNILYRREHAPLYRSANALERRVASEGIVFGVVDSVMMARSGDAQTAEDTVRLYQAARQIGVPFLFVDHVTKAARQKREPNGAYGSVVNENLARLQWQITAAPPQSKALRMTLHKSNNVGRLPDLAFTVDFLDGPERLESITIAQVDPAGVKIDIPIPTRILRALHAAGLEGMSASSLAETLDVPIGQIRPRLSELKADGAVTNPKHGIWLANTEPESDLPLPY